MLKAFAWMRWRMLANAIEHSGSRDTLQRLSIAMENLGPIIAAVLLIPSALILLGLGITSGHMIAGGAVDAMPFRVTRFLLLLVPVLVIVGPLVMPAADRTNPVRLLLLPIPRHTLYIAQSSAAFGDPWTMLMVPLICGIPIGLLAAGAFLPAAVALAGAILFILAIVGLSSLATSIMHLLARDRRRGELLALIFIIVLPLVGLVPGLMAGGSKRGTGEPREPVLPAWTGSYASRALGLHPAQMFTTGTQAAVTGQRRAAVRSLVGLGIVVTVLHGLGLMAFLKVLNSPGSTGARRHAPMSTLWTRRIPGLSQGASAVALAQLRLAMRTPRGRSIMLSPLAMLLIFGVMMYRGSGTVDFGPFHFGSGLGLATFAAAICMLSILPIAMNQFAVDGAGLTMTLLSPLPDADLLAGKAAGSALIQLPPLIVAVGLTLLIFPAGSRALWATLPLALIAIHFIVSPLAAICSALFPREVNMNSIGRGSNAHGAAGLLGMLSFVGAGLPTIGITLLAVAVLDRPMLAPVMMAAWCVIAYGIGRILFHPARRIFKARRESLVMLG
ncbi:MAG: hypothetical protein M3468_11380 [Acidobacteriota bacterium]|nr:hypothetical protein [Acidobacteriota bacterium]